jgi:hypothetical protein
MSGLGHNPFKKVSKVRKEKTYGVRRQQTPRKVQEGQQGNGRTAGDFC